MKIFFHIPGQIEQGLTSPERGESRWAQNWVKLLAEQGHELECEAWPGRWGNQTPIPNINISDHPNYTGQEYDIYINPCWWPGRDTGGVKAKIYVHMTYSFNDKYTDPNFIKDNHVLTYAFARQESAFIHEGNPFRDKTFCMAIPLAKKFGRNHFDKTGLTFTAKEVFHAKHDEKEKHWYVAGKNVIRAMIDLGRRHNLNCNFCMYNELNGTYPLGWKIIEREGIEALIESAANHRKFELIPLDKLMELLDESKVATPVISMGGSALEAITVGTMPLIWEKSPFDKVAAEENFLLRHNASYKNVYENLERLITDRQFYNRILAKYHEDLKDHLEENCIKNFNKIINWGKEKGYM